MDDKKAGAMLPAYELRLILDYYAKHPPPWTNDSPSVAKRKKVSKDIEIAESVLRLLSLAAKHFRNLWNWSEFCNYFINHDDPYVVWLACQCMSILLQFNESEKHSLVNRYMDQKSNLQYMIMYELKSGSVSHKDYIKLYVENQYITVEDISLPVVGSPKRDNDLVLVNSTKQNLRNLALAVQVGKAVCLVGPVGCGKSIFVKYLANITGHTNENLLTVQLGEDTDSKSMLGSYHCTDIPGEFVWRPGALTKAVIEGKWFLLEDIDLASSDLAAVLQSLIEGRSLTVPGFRDQIIPATGFQLFFTRRVITTNSGYHINKQNIGTDLLGKHYIQVNVEPLNKNELIEVVETKFPILKTIATKIIDVFLLFSTGFYNGEIILHLKYNERLSSTRDLMKWCSRIIKKFDVTSSESSLKVIQDAIDIFCCNTKDTKIRLEFASHIASLIGVVKTKAEFFLNEYKPIIVIEKDYCIVGRITLPRSGPFLTEHTLNSRFALTRSACCLLERIACCISEQESILLVGETGVGKTSVLQLLANYTGNKLIILNMNQQSDTVDLLGGYKPVELKIIVKPIQEEFEYIFRSEFNVEQNKTFLNHISTCFNNRKWSNLMKLMKHVIQKAVVKHTKKIKNWLDLKEKITRFEMQLKHCKTTMAFAFVEGSLIKALREGHWVLLDEINLASAETLQCLSSLLESDGTITMYEKADTSSIPRHPNFRLMAAMNPATDVGKKDLPAGIRNRFTEFFVDELTERSDLIILTACYLPDYDIQKLNALAKFYLIAKRECEQHLVDGTGRKPHYSLRTYCRALSITSSNPCQSVPRSLYESFCLSYLTQLDSFSHKRVESLIANTIFGEKLIQGIINQPIPKPKSKIESYVEFEGYWIKKGVLEPTLSNKYVLTDSVKKNLRDLVRAVSLSCFPILIQGDTCVGKTSLITYLANVSGNVLVRINNHEHTDLQEYIGSYAAHSVSGQLVFKEGVLVDAMRKGNWIVLDELNLAPTDVLEALNRVLDDNRELFISETQTIVKAHPGFRLFATQNPPGLYGGRKILSRAFKNRFIEMHFDEIPANELETILLKRCEIPLSYAKKIVSVMKNLQSTRKCSSVFSGKHGFITLRDLFRWGERYRLANAPDNYNWTRHLIEEGFLVLASKVRKPEEKQIIVEVLEKHFKYSLSLDELFTLNEKTSPVTRHILEKLQHKQVGFEHIYMSRNIRQMIVLACKAIEFKEPILLVGDTGCGKTTVCHLIASLNGQKLLTVNCHQHTECSDFLGGIRPVRNPAQNNDQKIFEWADGPLIDALINGHMFLADEISLAEDSVLERFNSLLEPERKLFLSEKIGNIDETFELVTHSEFRFIGTMNPGGDFGKKELSPALRNRLTEIWCDNADNYDLVEIINHNFLIFHDYSLFLSQSMVDFINWLMTTEHIKNYLKLNVSIRTCLIWVKFIESMMHLLPIDDVNYNSLRAFLTFYKEGAVMLFLDKKTKSNFSYDQAIDFALKNSLKKYYPSTITNESRITFVDMATFCPLKHPPEWFGYDGYYIPKGDLPMKSVPEFSFDAITTKKNVIRLLRCMQIENKAILLEGSPGVGKTSLIQTVSAISGNKLTRINLSEQTDVSDLFGADLPTENGFKWRDGPFLRALKDGNWILLDELNLASQSVLEGLNAVLDHRGELYIPELGQTFFIESKKTRLFACQNPMAEGGSRKGLPKSFLNRFLQVHLNTLDCNDIVRIIHKIYERKTKKVRSLNLEQVVRFTMSFCNKYNIDMNLRDILRWVDVTITLKCNILEHLPLIFTDRTQNLQKIENEVFNQIKTLLKVKQCQKHDFLRIFPSATMFNRIVIPRKRAVQVPLDHSNNKLILRSHIHTLNSLAVCMKMNWMPILIGSGSGKTSVIKTFTQLCGHELRVLSVNSTMDTTEILGAFEQVDFNKHIEELARSVENAVYLEVGQQLINGQNDYISLLSLLYEYKRMTDVCNDTVTMTSEINLYKKRIFTLIQITNELKYLDLSNLLKALGERVSTVGSFNSLGKFEWIDSILIKCLIDGCWLLIDNVNLCSSAVLDRLNGLLEPNGVLELGEKGIDSSGHITIIKPHKNFRLFLAMDSKHGNISRAMKNRGVEIFMTPLENINNHDINSMLELQGVNDKTIRRTLIEIHTFMKEQITGHIIGINDLLRAAYLTSLNIKPGKSILQSIREICIDSYVHYFNVNSKQNAILEIDRILEEEYSKISNDLWYPNLKTIDVLQSSNLCYIKQQCKILQQYEYLEKTKLEDLLLCYFGRSSSSDIAIRTQWLSVCMNFDIEAINNFIKELQNLKFDSLHFITKSVDYIDAKDLPFDFRYLPVNYFNKKCLIHNSIPLAENKIHLMLDHAFNKALDGNIESLKLSKKKIMIADGGIKHDYAVISIAYNDFVDFFMNESALIIDEYNCLLFKEMIIWTRTVEQILFEKIDKENEFVVVLIHCYFKVIVNHFIPVMNSITNGEKYANSEELKMLGNQILTNYLTPKPYSKLIKSFNSQLKLPCNLCCKFHGDIFIEMYRQNRHFMTTMNSNNLQELITYEFKNQRDSLLLFEYTDCKLHICNNKEIKIKKMNDNELNLIPLWELIIEQNFLTLIKPHLFNENTQKPIDNYTFMESLLQMIPTVSPLYYNALKNNSYTINILMEALEHSMNSVAVETPKSYLEWSNKFVNLEKQNVDIDEEMLYSFEQPLFTVFITNLLLKKNEPYYTFFPRPIRFIEKNNHNLMCVMNFIWNSSKLSNLHFENIETLIRLVELCFSSFLPVEFSSLEELHLMRDNKKFRSSVANKLNHHESMINAIYDTAELLSQIKRNLHLYNNKKYSSNIELNNIINNIEFKVGRLWVLTGMCLFQVFSAINLIDPLQKLKVRVECSKIEKTKLQSRLNAETLFCETDGVSELFPFKKYYIQRLKVLNKDHKSVGYRPEPPKYSFILEEVNRFSKMFGLDSNTYNLINSKHSDREAYVKEMDNWLNSVSNFYNRLNVHYASYPDILSGILLSINQMRYGVRILKNYYKWSAIKDKSIISDEEQLLTLFGEFPRFCPDIMKIMKIDHIVSLSINDKFRWYKLCLEELNNMLYLSGQLYMTDRYISAIEYVLDKFMYNWTCLQDEAEKKIREESSLYKQKSMCETLPIEIEISIGVAHQFPTTKYSDFHDIEMSEVNGDVSRGDINKEIYNLTDKDINDICRLHAELVRPAASAHWLFVNPVLCDENEAVNRIKYSFSDRFCLFGKLFMSKFMYLNKSMDSKMIPWLLMATEIANNPVVIDKGYYDFYRDSNIEYAKKTFEVLKNIDDQTQKLLNQWPDHPTLQTISKLLNRIMDFDWSSPTCRFLIGLELLLTKLHEWEEVSHRGVSLHEISIDVTRCVQEYRNLELSTWKNCLKTSLKKIENNSSKWWFHLFSIFQAYLSKQEDFKRLVTSIQTFMETSTLGEYMTRLELLYTFHCDVVSKKKTKTQIELCNASWNLYKYYYQFKDCVNIQIDTMSADIKKKFHDFIKIIKWNDINYWSVKETVSKVQQTLHTYTRQYEEILNSPVSFVMTTQSSVTNTKSDPYVLPLLKSNIYLEKCEIFLNIENSLNKVNVLRNLNRYSKKLFSISDQIINNCSYYTHLNELNNFINDVMKSAQELHDLKVDSTLSKIKQKSQAKYILQQKRKALSELFKALQNIGLSYKAGLIGYEQMDCSVEFARLPPIDINSALEFLIPKCIDDNLRLAWSDCETYFLKSISQNSALKVASGTPKLGQQEMNRIKGFVNDLRNTTWNTKKILASNIDSLTKFRSMIYLSNIIIDSNGVMFDPSEDFQQPINFVINCINILQQFKVAIQCCSKNIDYSSDNSITSLLNLSSCNDKNEHFDKIISDLSDMINLAQSTLSSIIDKRTHNAMRLCNLNFMVRETYDALLILCNELTEYINDFYKNTWISNNSTINEHHFEQRPFVSNNNEPQLDEINDLVNQVLISVEKLHKKHTENIETENDNDILLKSLIIEPLSSDLEDFNFISINKQFKNMLKSSVGNNVLKSCLPLFEQYAMLVQYFITQQTIAYRVVSKMNYLLSVLFTDLTSNGFCIPDEFLEGDDCIQSDGKSGIGLTDGDGTKDVSDQIDSQDQLEDAKRDFNDSVEDNNDLKEEENGIEMSDNFDGKLHDQEKDENENSDDGEDDFDKEMGETNDGADILDEKLWGSDSEDQNDDEQENLKENAEEGGEVTGNSELQAKTNNETAEQDQKTKTDENNLIKDFNELNDDDQEDTGQEHENPYHGNLQPPPEPESMDLPNDLQLDEGEINDQDISDNNPFDIDTMKENIDDIEENDQANEKPIQDTNNLEDTSDEENDDNTNKIDDTKVDDDEIELDDSKQSNDNGKRDEQKFGEQCIEEETTNQENRANPLADETSQVETQPSYFENNVSDDKACENTNGQDHSENLKDNNEAVAVGLEQQGVGQSQKENNDAKQGHSVDDDRGFQSENPGVENKKRKRKPGEMYMDRTLADSSDAIKKRLKTTDTDTGDEHSKHDEGDDSEIEQQKGNIFKHVTVSNSRDIDTLDAATNEQLEKQAMPNNENENGEKLDENDLIGFEEDETRDEELPEINSEMLSEKTKKDQNNKKNLPSSMNELEIVEDTEEYCVDGDTVLTHTVERGMDTMFHTIDFKEDSNAYFTETTDHKENIKNQLANWFENENKKLNNDEVWNTFVNATSNLSQELSEQLRLILEPSKASKLQGDFRTGRRINMRRVIPFIASQFKKDKIWLKRTKLSKRQYQIIIAIDNSSSMMNSHSKVIAFESLALVSKALTLVEAGDLGIMSYGETPKIIHPLGEPFGVESGSKLINDFTFDEQKTKVGKLIEFATAIFEDKAQLNTDRPAQLLIIVSDGRGVISEGAEFVRHTIRTAKDNGIFIVFIVVDNPMSQESVLDIKVPIFENNSVRIESYMDNFPFPYYIILRDIDKLPCILSDALMEWFDLVTN